MIGQKYHLESKHWGTVCSHRTANNKLTLKEFSKRQPDERCQHCVSFLSRQSYRVAYPRDTFDMVLTREERVIEALEHMLNEAIRADKYSLSADITGVLAIAYGVITP